MSEQLTEDTYANKLNKLLADLKPELMELKQFFIKFKGINSPYKNNFNFLVSLSNTELLFERKGNIEEYVHIIIEQLHNILKLMNTIVQDDSVRDLYLDAGIFDELLKHREKILKILES